MKRKKQKTKGSHKKKCSTCMGYGMWGIGDKVPMGEMDAQDGMPTIACPECGTNPNDYAFDKPSKKYKPLK